MSGAVRSFRELKGEEVRLAGGKGGTLARLFQNGYPVPDGFIVLPSAFVDECLSPKGRTDIHLYLERMRQARDGLSFAVRSSALAEDSLSASYAGQFHTVLNVGGDTEVLDAIQTVRRSAYGSGAGAYSRARGMGTDQQMAVVVQQMVQADIAGVLFTADPISGSRDMMTGDFVFGPGEQLVSGKANAYSFTLGQGGTFDGAPDLAPFARSLYEMGIRLQRELGSPQDIEWAVSKGNLYVLQSRPITTLSGLDAAVGEWNDSLKSDSLWSNVNFGEAVPEVMTPLSWSVLQLIYESWKVLPGYCTSGNIGGRPYLNLSVFASALSAVGQNRQDILNALESLLYTRIPAAMDIPIVPLPRLAALSIIANFVKVQVKQYRAASSLPRFIAENPAWCARMRERIEQTKTKPELLALWRGEIEPHLVRTVWSVMASVSSLATETTRLRRDLEELVEPDDVDALMSNLSVPRSASGALGDGVGPLASLGPVLGIASLARAEMDRATYLALYGHRGPNEFELSAPRPAEASGWLDEQLSQYQRFPVDVGAQLSRQRERFEAAWSRLQARHPRKAQALRTRIDEVAEKARGREAVRSEYVRDRWVVRSFALRAGDLTGLKDDIFFLSVGEVLGALSGDEASAKCIAARKEAYRKYCALPAYPSIIRGRFDPFCWQASPNRLDDADAGEIRGSAGSPGRVEGVVRRLDHPEEGEQFQQGEVLVAAQTDIAWTPLFPRAAALVTDVGAPLSHAAIVARELGIPAVVGCAGATTRLRTGDRVLVDGGQGVVTVLSSVAESTTE